MKEEKIMTKSVLMLLISLMMTSFKVQGSESSSSSTSNYAPIDRLSDPFESQFKQQQKLPDPFIQRFSDPFEQISLQQSTLPLQNRDPFKAVTYKLKVATFNIWGLVTSKNRSERISAIARYFTKNPRGIEILCLQELWMADDYRTLRSALSLEFPNGHYFKSGVVGSGLAVFSKYPIDDAWWHGFTLTGKAHRLFDGDWFAGKGVGAVKIKHPIIGDIDIFNTHLIANYSPTDYDADWYKSHRATQLYELIRHVDRTSSPTAYTLVLGDLNTQPIEDAYTSMIRGNELYTTYRRPLRNIWRDIAKNRKAYMNSFTSPLNQQEPDQWSSTTMRMNHLNNNHYTCNLRTNSYYNSKMPEQQIDHIMYVPDGRMKCVAADVFLTHPTKDSSGQLGPSYSDHAAVMATFIINPSDQVILGRSDKVKKRKTRSQNRLQDSASKSPNEGTQRLMVRLNEDIQGLYSQQWSYRIGAIMCSLTTVALLVASVFLMRRANCTKEIQRQLTIVNAPDKYKWNEKISFNWYAGACLILLVPFCLLCHCLIWNAVVFLPQEIFAFKEFQYEWALWLRRH